MELFLVGLV